MPEKINNVTSGKELGLGEAIFDQPDTRKNYRVMLEGENKEIETAASFAIKISILLKVPVTRIKHTMRSLPATLWAGPSKIQAQRLLALIEEAGGLGRIEEKERNDKSADPKSPKSQDMKACRSCGFSIKNGDKFCGFCTTPVTHTEQTETHVKVEGKQTVPMTRLVFYLALFIAILIIALALR